MGRHDYVIRSRFSIARIPSILLRCGGAGGLFQWSFHSGPDVYLYMLGRFPSLTNFAYSVLRLSPNATAVAQVHWALLCLLVAVAVLIQPMSIGGVSGSGFGMEIGWANDGVLRVRGYFVCCSLKTRRAEIVIAENTTKALRSLAAYANFAPDTVVSRQVYDENMSERLGAPCDHV